MDRVSNHAYGLCKMIVQSNLGFSNKFASFPKGV